VLTRRYSATVLVMALNHFVLGHCRTGLSEPAFPPISEANCREVLRTLATRLIGSAKWLSSNWRVLKRMSKIIVLNRIITSESSAFSGATRARFHRDILCQRPWGWGAGEGKNWRARSSIRPSRLPRRVLETYANFLLDETWQYDRF
jgi:hypothetical protein